MCKAVQCTLCIAFFKVLKNQSWFTLGRKQVRLKLESKEPKKNFC